MKKSRFTESPNVAILKEADAGMKVAEVCRAHGISQPTYYVWKRKYGGMEVSELRRIKELEAEHGKLKRMDADLAMASQAPVARPREAALECPAAAQPSVVAGLHARHALVWEALLHAEHPG